MTDLPNPQVDGAAPDSPAPEPSLRDTIKAAMTEATAPPADQGQARTPPGAEPLRDDQGRFVPRQTEGPKRETLTLPRKVEGEVLPPSTKPPEGWNAKAKEKFATLDPDIQAEVLRREKEAHQKITSQDTDRDFGSKIRKAAEPYTAIIQAEGGNHEAAFRDYLNTAYILRVGTQQQKLQALQIIAQRFNVPLAPLQQQAQQPAQLAPQDVQRLVQAEIQNQRQAWEQASLKGEIDSFAADSAHEHFDKLKPVMAALLESGQAETLQDAYDQATWANPEIRSTLTAAQAATTQQRSRTDAAKRAAVSVTGAPGAGKPANGAGTERSLRDEIRANLNAATGRV